MTQTFIIKGLVREKESGVGLGGLMVKAYDKDLLFDDLLGAAETACDGSFCIVSEAEDFREFLESRPDMYVRVLIPGTGDVPSQEIFSSENVVRWNAQHVEYFVVEIPHTLVESLPELPSGPHPDQGHPSTSDPDAHEPCAHEHHKAYHPTPITRIRHVYLKIEPVPAYSPVAPDDAEHDK